MIFPWRKLNFYFQVVSSWRLLLSTFALNSRISSATEWCRPCTCHLSLWKFTRALILFIQRTLFSWCSSYILAFTLFPFSLPHVYPSLEGGDLMQTSNLGWSVTRSLVLYIMDVEGLCVCSHLLMDEQDTDPKVQLNIIRSYLIVTFIFKEP